MYLSNLQLTPVLAGKRYVNESNLKLFYKTKKVRVTEEVLLYDFNTIVGTVGGSLGLFLGFSCYGVIQMLVDWLNIRILGK